MKETLLRLDAVIARTGLARTQIYEGMVAKTFPQSVAIGERAVAWVESEVDGWIADRIAERKQ